MSPQNRCRASWYVIFVLYLGTTGIESLQEGNENPFTRLPHSPQYRQILETRKKLPVFAHMDGFYKLVSIRRSHLESRPCVANAPAKFTKHQIIVMIGETGTGKTTQYAHLSLLP